MIINYKNLPTKEYLKRYLEVLNTAQPSKSKRLTDSEISVLVEFMMLPEKFENKRFGTLAKSKVCESLDDEGYTLTRANLNNKIYSLVSKGYLRKDVDGVIYPKQFIEHGVKNILHAVDDKRHFDIVFRFSEDDN